MQGIFKTAIIFPVMELGTNIRKYRKARGLTQAELAKKLGTAQVLDHGLRARAGSAVGGHAAGHRQSPQRAPRGVLRNERRVEAPEEKKGSGTRREAQLQKIFFRELPAVKQRAVLEHAKGLRTGKV